MVLAAIAWLVWRWTRRRGKTADVIAPHAAPHAALHPPEFDAGRYMGASAGVFGVRRGKRRWGAREAVWEDSSVAGVGGVGRMGVDEVAKETICSKLLSRKGGAKRRE